MRGASVASVLWLVLACGAVPAALWRATHERFVQPSADVVLRTATPSDLVVVSPSVGGADGVDVGALMRPLGALAVVVFDPDKANLDIASLPFDRVFLVGPDLGTLAEQLHGVERPGAEVVVGRPAADGTSLVRLLPRLRVSVVRDGAEHVCTRRSGAMGGWQCGDQRWQHVSPVMMEGAGRQHACLWAHPANGAELRVTFPAGAWSGTTWLQFADEALKDTPHPPVELSAFRGEEEVGALSCTNTGTGRCTLELAPPAQDAGVLSLRWTTSNAARQVVCLGGRLALP